MNQTGRPPRAPKRKAGPSFTAKQPEKKQQSKPASLVDLQSFNMQEDFDPFYPEHGACLPAEDDEQQQQQQQEERELRDEDSDTELSEVSCQDLAPVSPGLSPCCVDASPLLGLKERVAAKARNKAVVYTGPVLQFEDDSCIP